MNYRKKKQEGSAITIRVVCAIVFILFSWCWLYYFQNDLLMMAQHVLSHGITHYNRLVGAVGITFVLYLLQHLIHKVTHLNKSFYALTYFPSMLALGMLTDIVPDPAGGITHMFSWWLIIVYLLLWGGCTYFFTKLQELDDDPNPHILSRSMWMNLLIMVLLMVLTVSVGNTNAVFHYRMRAERCLLEGDVDGALAAGKKSLECDEHLVMLRMQALARKDAIGDKLFEYKVCGNSKSILPTDGHSTLLLYPVDSVYKISWGSEEAKSLKSIKVTMLDDEYNEQGEETVDAGEHFLPIRTDNSTFVDCRLDDGRLVRLKFSQTDYPSQIDGVNVEDLFEGLVYAG